MTDEYRNHHDHDPQERHTNREEGITECPAGMGVGRRVYHGAIHPLMETMDRLHQLTFMVALDPLDGDPQLLPPLADRLLQGSQCGGTVDVGFPCPEEIEVGPVQYGDEHLPLESLEPRLELIQVLLGLPALGPKTG